MEQLDLSQAQKQATCDSATAQSVIGQNMTQTTQLHLNQAIVRNQSYLVLEKVIPSFAYVESMPALDF